MPRFWLFKWSFKARFWMVWKSTKTTFRWVSEGLPCFSHVNCSTKHSGWFSIFLNVQWKNQSVAYSRIFSFLTKQTRPVLKRAIFFTYSIWLNFLIYLKRELFLEYPYHSLRFSDMVILMARITCSLVSGFFLSYNLKCIA